MSGSFFLAWRYLCHHKGTTAILVGAISILVFLPLALEIIISSAAVHVRARAESTPLLIGARGSPLELVLGALYFDDPLADTMHYAQVDRVLARESVRAIPLHCQFRTRDRPIVGTTPAYAALRGLQIADGREANTRGECVVGSEVARTLNVGIGDKIPVVSDDVFALRDAPLRLNVVGLLAPTATPDDEAIFVDLETTWIIEGLGHGHASTAPHGSSAAAQYTDITPENAHDIHFHGDRSGFPITAIIAVPENERAHTLLLGDYLTAQETVQIVRPREVIDALLARVMAVRQYFLAVMAIVGAVTLMTVALVIALSVRLRAAEIRTISAMGCSRSAITTILGCQILIVILASLAISSGLTLLVSLFEQEVIRVLISR